MKLTDMEAKYQQSISETLKEIADIGRVDLVVGVPFLSTNKELHAIISILESGLNTYYPELKSLIIGMIKPSRSLTRAMNSYQSDKTDRIILTQLDKSLAGRGWAYRGLMDFAHKLSADLYIVEPDLLPGPDAVVAEGLTPDWVKIMYQPIKDDDARFVLPRFKMSHLANSVSAHLVFPLLASLFNVELQGCLYAGMAISHQILPELTNGLFHNGDQIYEYGLNYWIAARILEMKTPVAEVYLGVKPQVSMPVGIDYFFNQAARTLFDFLGKSQKVWMENPQAVRSALSIGRRDGLFIRDMEVDIRPHVVQFHRGYDRYYEAIWSRIFSEDIRTQLAQMVKVAAAGVEGFIFPSGLWAQVVYETIIAYHFIPELEREDLVNSLSALFEGRLAGYFREIADNTHCGSEQVPTQYTACPLNARINLEAQVDDFVNRKSSFLEHWLHHKEQLQPFLPEISYWEYIPGVPLLLPHVVRSQTGNIAYVYEFYESLLKEYADDFKAFIKENLQLAPEDGSVKVGQGISSLIARLEEDLDKILIPGSLHSKEGVKRISEKIFRMFPSPQSMSLKEEVAARLIRENPPRNLIITWGYQDEEELLEHHNALDVMAIAAWSETDRFSTENTYWLQENLTPDDFEMSPVIPIVVDHSDFPALTGMPEASSLDHLTSRVVISNLRTGSGGAFPKIRFLTTILEHIIESEEYGRIWNSYMRECGAEDFAKRVINSIESHWGIGMFSAYSIFEHIQQTVLRDKLLEIAHQDWEISGFQVDHAKEHMIRMAKAYHLGLTLPDGVFVTCCMWSWANYSFKGGKKIPTPLSLMVERRWFSGELFSRLFERVAGSREDIMPIIVDLMGQKRGNDNLDVLYLGATSLDTDIVIGQKVERDCPLAGRLVRSPYNPILAPLADHGWENKYVLNCGAIRVNGKVYIFYRAVGDEGISRIGLAISKNGLQVDERFADPVFSPANESEKMGCEDPRLMEMDGRIYMLYTAYDGVTPQIALASISEEDMIAGKWTKWRRHGLMFPGFPNKDAVLFPERFDGKLALYHRIAPSIWIAYSDKFETPWPREGHKIIMGTRSGMFWDAVKIGAGATPLKTKYGWLHIYHGVDYSFTYRLGIFLTALQKPGQLLYRSPNPVLEPEASYEVGVSGKSWVPNVVFTCGAVPATDKTLLEDDDEILVYYGGADTVIGVATAKLRDLLPERYRRLP